MDDHSEIWQQYYKKALSRPHQKRTEFAIKLNESGLNVAIDCGCGTGSDIAFLEQQAYQVYGFDVNPDSIAICRDRFGRKPLVEISESGFEHYDYPKSGVVIANSSLFFADPTRFDEVWNSIENCLEVGGVFSGDFMGVDDSWAQGYRTPTTPLAKAKVFSLFNNFEIVRFHERDEKALTALGKMKHWHTYSVVAIKRHSSSDAKPR
ncbi:class I SAM-dependent methyltransferase [Vibrio splendidus]|uniref:class I SAM-dependent methyltransferase n=1 Tax=Vibrio splendidus TaxID=29497 RepID=UPI000C82A2D3|nr:class I SAM-dependent methyltransferase [Vibrio splendidus]PMI79680.1 SAM-dependent methyltransferase [Vibrio splendidus]PMK60034.1 SAM-dependent methyltransferase [Vibrio splendidus]